MTRRTTATLAVLTAFLLTTGVGSAFAQNALDWGGSFSTSNTLQAVPEGSDDDAFSTSERLVLYLTSPLGSSWEFVSQAAATFSSEPAFALDVEKLYFQNTIDFVDPAIERAVEQRGDLLLVTSRLGRFTLSEPTGHVLRHTVDGVNVTINGVRSTVELGAGYAGFLNKRFSSLSMSLQDSIDSDDTEIYFGPQRLLGRGSIAYPNLFLGQNLTLAFAFQQDLRDPESVVQEEQLELDVDDPGALIDTQYGILQVDGQIPGVTGLYYGLGYILNTGRTMSLIDDPDVGNVYRYAPIRGHLVDAQVQYFMPQFFASSGEARFTFSTGDDDYSSFVEGNTADNATMFTAATPSSSGAVFALQSGNSMVSEVSWSMKPFSGSEGIAESLLTRVVLYNFFRSAGSGPVSASSVDVDSDGSYLGSEIDVDLRWRPFSDLGVGLTTGFLFANDDVLTEGSDSFDHVVRLNASLSF